MCLLTIATGASRRFPIIILNNRDEYVGRSTSQLKLFGAAGTPMSNAPTATTTTAASGGGGDMPSASEPTSSAPSPSTASFFAAAVVPPHRAHLLCAIDTSIPSGGTWMGVNVATGAFASVTNSPQCASQMMHLPTLCPRRIKLTAAGASSFDFIGYLSKVLLGQKASPPTSFATAAAKDNNDDNGAETSTSGDGDDCCGLKPSSLPPASPATPTAFPRPFLAFAPERSRGCVVGEYLSDSRWVFEKLDDAEEGDSKVKNNRRWSPVLPTNICVGGADAHQLEGPASPSFVASPSHASPKDRDLFYDGYNLICGNLVAIAEGLRRRWEEKRGDEQSTSTTTTTTRGRGGAAATHQHHFLYSTNRQQPFPLRDNNPVAATETSKTNLKKATVYSPTWESTAAKSRLPSVTDPPLLAHQPALLLGKREQSLPPSPPSLTVDTVANTFLNNPLEPKSQHLTACVRKTLEDLFSTDGGDKMEMGNTSRPASDFVAETLIPSLAPCLCERPNFQIDISADGKHRPLLAINPMGGLSDEEYRAALRKEIESKLGDFLANSPQQKKPSTTAVDNEDDESSSSSSPLAQIINALTTDREASIAAIVEDVMAHKSQRMREVIETEEREVHSNVYTVLQRDAVGAGVFKTRTQTIAVVEDTSDESCGGGGDEKTEGAARYRLHYYMRDTTSSTEHGPWQVQIVDLPSQ